MGSLELMKVLSDPRRIQILNLAKEPITVKQIAEALDEKPSRLYYHVNKLVELELLKITETRQTGNLVEKFYRSEQNLFVKGDIRLQAENIPFALESLQRALMPGIKLYEKALEKVNEQLGEGVEEIKNFPYHISFNYSSGRMTGQQWRRANALVLKTIGDASGENSNPPEGFFPEVTHDEDEEEGTYQHIIISYRIEDAIKLGLIDSEE